MRADAAIAVVLAVVIPLPRPQRLLLRVILAVLLLLHLLGVEREGTVALVEQRLVRPLWPDALPWWLLLLGPLVLLLAQSLRAVGEEPSLLRTVMVTVVPRLAVV